MENLNEFIGLLLIGSTLLYKKYLSAAARACKNSDDKNKCINRFKIKGYEAQANKLKSDINKCSQSENSGKCKNILSDKITKINNKLLKLISKEKIKMTTKELKSLAGSIVMESEYSDSAKKQLLNFILNEASEHQIKALILDGDIERLDEQASNLVDKRFDINLDNAIQENINETNEFITIGRSTICNYLESQNHDPEKFKEMVNFIVNEASDYQILSMLVEDKIPNELFDEGKAFDLTESLNTFAGTSFMLTELTPAAIDKMIDKNVNTLRHLKGPKAAQYKAKIQDRLKKLATAKQNALKTPTSMGSALNKIPKKQSQTTSAGQLAKDTYNKAKTGITNKYNQAMGSKTGQQISRFAQSPAGKAAGGLAAAALVGMAAYKIYKNYLSQAARSCKNSPDKSACMNQYKNKAVQAQIAKLSSGMGQCSNSKDPQKCKAAIQNKIAKLRSKMA